MQTFQEFLTTGRRGNNWATIFKMADESGLDSTETVTPATKTLHSLKRESFSKYMRKKLSYVAADINYRELCLALKAGTGEDYIRDELVASFCHGRYCTVLEDTLVEKIDDDCEERKIMFFNINAEDYCMDREEEDGYVAHGVCAMLVPRKRKGYDLYYMNPHGEVMKPYTYYELIKTRTRCQKLDFDKEIIDVVVMRSIVDYCNKHFDHDIHYDGSLRHNYLGVNLQEEDVHGVCYIFPHLVYYYFGKYFTEKRELEAEGIKLSLPSFKEMLDSGDFNLSIHSCFVEFDTNYKKAIMDYIKVVPNTVRVEEEVIVGQLITCLEKAKYRFLKNASDSFVSFICQDYFRKQCYYTEK